MEMNVSVKSGGSADSESSSSLLWPVGTAVDARDKFHKWLEAHITEVTCAFILMAGAVAGMNGFPMTRRDFDPSAPSR